MPGHRERLERIVVRLLAITARCGDLAIRHELRQVADELVDLIEEREATNETNVNDLRGLR
jgi:hypothetical protein